MQQPGWFRSVTNLHYAWVMLGVAIAIRLISSVERTASSVLVAYMVDPAGEFGWSRSVVGLALSLQWIFSGVFGPPAGWLGDRYGLRLHHGDGRRVICRDLGAHWPDQRPVAVHRYLRHSHERRPGHFPGAAGHGRHRVVSQASGRGHGAVAVGPGPGQRVVCAAHGGACSPSLAGAGPSGGPALWAGCSCCCSSAYFHNEPAEIGLRPLGADPSTPIQPVQSGPRPGADHRLSQAGPAHVCLLEPHRHPLLGVRRTRHHRRLSGGYRPHAGAVPGHRLPWW